VARAERPPARRWRDAAVERTLTGFARHPRVNTRVIGAPGAAADDLLADPDAPPAIPRAAGQSYGDAALVTGGVVLQVAPRDEEPADGERSAITVDPARERVLLTFHRKLGRWMQFGGHCDGDANLLGVAWRETQEESGIVPRRISTLPIDVDVNAIPARAGEPEHLHLDTRFLIELDPQRTPVISAESLELGWFGAEDAGALELDDSVRRLLRLALRRH